MMRDTSAYYKTEGARTSSSLFATNFETPSGFDLRSSLCRPLLVFAALCGIVAFSFDSKTAAQVSADKNDNAADKKIKVLILDGQNNHDTWPKTTWMMKQYLEETGRFQVEIARTKFTWQGQKWFDQFPLNDGKRYEHLDHPKTDPDFKPAFKDYQVVINNMGYGAARLPTETELALVDFMKMGGGMVSVHAADNCWPEWEEYNRMIGLGGWGGRNEKSGPYVYFNDQGKIVVDNSDGTGGHHGAQHDFPIMIREPKHPIMAGLPTEFLHGRDELYEQLRGPAKFMTVLATAYAAAEHGGSKRHEPVLMTIQYGLGRVFHTVLGHADYSMESVGFITTFVRGTEWAATGKVTIPTPQDFPGKEKTSRREFQLRTLESNPR